MRRLSNRLVRGGALDVVATAAPGIEDILVLGKVKQLERSGGVDLILLDAPAAGHAITFLESARGLLDAVTVGPINTQARDVMELLTDPERCSVLLVTLPEETPVNELVDTAYSLEDRVGVTLGPVVVNGLYPERPGHRCRPGGSRRSGAGRAHAGRGRRARRSRGVPRRAARRATRASGPAVRPPAAAADPPSVRVHAPTCPSPTCTCSPTPRSPASPTSPRCRDSRADPRSGPERQLHRAVLRHGWRRQDDDRRIDRDARRASGSPQRRRDDRPGQASCRRTRARGAHEHTVADRGGVVG